MKELAEYIIKGIVENPDDVEIKVEEAPEEETVYVYVTVNEEDKGIVIGKQGKNINAIRTLLAIKARQRVILKVE